MYLTQLFTLILIIFLVPELQGEPDDIARSKCKLAVEKVSKVYNYIDKLTNGTLSLESKT